MNQIRSHRYLQSLELDKSIKSNNIDKFRNVITKYSESSEQMQRYLFSKLLHSYISGSLKLQMQRYLFYWQQYEKFSHDSDYTSYQLI